MHPEPVSSPRQRARRQYEEVKQFTPDPSLSPRQRGRRQHDDEHNKSNDHRASHYATATSSSTSSTRYRSPTLSSIHLETPNDTSKQSKYFYKYDKSKKPYTIRHSIASSKTQSKLWARIFLILLALGLCTLYLFMFKYVFTDDKIRDPTQLTQQSSDIQADNGDSIPITSNSEIKLPHNNANSLLVPGFEHALEEHMFSADDITFFTVFHPETEHHYWLRVIYSWSLQLSAEKILVFVKTIDDCSMLSVLPNPVQCRVTSCWNQAFDAPSVKCLIDEADEIATTSLMAFIEDHILVFKDFIPSILKVGSKLEHFFIVGQTSVLSLQMDPTLDLPTWQHDVETAMFYDSSSEQMLLEESEHKLHANSNHSHSLHYFSYLRHDLSSLDLSRDILMGGGQFYGHRWEKHLVSSLLLQDTATIVDVTPAVIAVELTHADSSNLTTLVNTYNEELSTNSTGRKIGNLGRLENAHFRLHGRCPTCTLKENREADLPLILIRRSNADQQVIIIAVNADYLALAFNWICRARTLNIHNYIMLAEDRISYRILRKMDVAVVLRNDAPYRKMAAAPGTKEFQETLFLRAVFFQQVLTLGFSMVLSHLDTVWFDDPLAMFAASDCDMFVQMEGGDKAGGGILTIRSNPLGVQFAKDYLSCEKYNLRFILTHGRSRFKFSDDPDIDCVELISGRLVRRSGLKRCELDPMRYASEDVFFDLQLPQRRAIYPSFVHLNKAEGITNKTNAFLNWDLWAVNEEALTIVPSMSLSHSHGEIKCLSPPLPLPSPSFELRESIVVVINILVSSDFAGLKDTLDHLVAASYEQVTANIRVTVQQPEQVTPSTSADHLKVSELLDSFEWPHGSKDIIYLDNHVGVSDRWLDTFVVGESSDSQVFQLLLHPGLLLSPQWWMWCRRALLSYYYDPFEYQSGLMGIHLGHSLDIVGETPKFRYGSRLPSTVLNSQNITLYNYQYIPLFGTVFFPRHFIHFLHWYMTQNHDNLRQPCVPTLISNTWYLQEPKKNWWQWLVRFTFESGWYALHSNWHSLQGSESKPHALMVDETPFAGHLTVSLVKKLAARESVMPRRSTIKLYDFHMEEWTLDPNALQRRKYVFPPVPMPPHFEVVSKFITGAKEESGLFERLQKSTEWTEFLTTKRGELGISDASPEALLEGEEVHEAEGNEDDDGLTVTEVIVETMLQEMKDNYDDDDPSNDNSYYAEQLKRISRKINAARRRTAHAHAHVRGSDVDRCYIMAEEPVQPVLCPGPLCPAPVPFNITLTMVELYENIYKTASRKLPKPGDLTRYFSRHHKFIVYQPTKLVPFDRHLRGIYFTFLLSLISERIFLIDLPDFASQFECPLPTVKCLYSQFKPIFFNRTITKAVIDDAKLKEKLRTTSFDRIHPEQLIFHTDQTSADRLLFLNKMYAGYPAALFDTNSRMRRTGTIMQFIMGKPKPELIAASEKLSSTLYDGRRKYSVCVHIVPPPHMQGKKITVDNPLPGVDEDHWACVKSNLVSLQFRSDDTTIFFTTSRPSEFAFDLAKTQLSRFGHVVTSVDSWDMKKSSLGMCNATVKSNHVNSITQEIRYDPYNVNGFLLGECDVSISSGTTYGIFNAARTGFVKKAFIYKPAPPPVKKDGVIIPSTETSYCGPMHRVDQKRENDIHF